MDPDRYAIEQAGLLRDDWQFSRIFASVQARPGFTALLALRAELQNVIAQANEPGILAMKFEWWRTEVERGFGGDAQHPLARALGTHLRAASAPEYCLELVDAAETESGADTLSEQDFGLYLYRSGGVLAEQLAALSGFEGRKHLDAARRLGQLKRFTDMLLATGAMLRAGRWLFPVTWLQENELDPRTFLENGSDALMQRMLSGLDRERIETRTAMENAELPPALALQWALAQRDHAKLRDNPRIMLEPRPLKGNNLARLWTAWRGAQKAARGEK